MQPNAATKSIRHLQIKGRCVLPNGKSSQRLLHRREEGLGCGARGSLGNKRCQFDRLYQRVTDDLDALLSAIGLKTAASFKAAKGGIGPMDPAEATKIIGETIRPYMGMLLFVRGDGTDP